MGSGAPISAQSVPSASADGIRRARSVHSHYHPRQRMGSGEPDQCTVTTIRVSGWDQESPISPQSVPSASADGIRRARSVHSHYHPRQRMGSGGPISAQSVPSASADGIRRARSAHSQYHPRQRRDQESPISPQSVPSASADELRYPALIGSEA